MTTFTDGTPVETDRGLITNTIDLDLRTAEHLGRVLEHGEHIAALNRELDDIQRRWDELEGK